MHNGSVCTVSAAYINVVLRYVCISFNLPPFFTRSLQFRLTSSYLMCCWHSLHSFSTALMLRPWCFSVAHSSYRAIVNCSFVSDAQGLEMGEKLLSNAAAECLAGPCPHIQGTVNAALWERGTWHILCHGPKGT